MIVTFMDVKVLGPTNATTHQLLAGGINSYHDSYHRMHERRDLAASQSRGRGGGLHAHAQRGCLAGDAGVGAVSMRSKLVDIGAHF